jgi:tetratricopeptide (TPR) repeat protein
MMSGNGGAEASSTKTRGEKCGPIVPQESMAGKGSATSAWIIALLLLLAILPYVNTLQNGFVYDDHNEVITNPFIRSFAHVGDIFSTRILAHLGVRGATNYYRPISIFGFLICYKLFGLLPYGFHLANLVLHALIVCLLFGLTKRLFQDQWLAFATAAIFALHPIHTESVAWVSGVTDLDLAVFYLATFWFFLASARPQGARSEWMQLGMVGSSILALLSKEQAVTLPLLAMIYEHLYRGDRARTTWRQKVARYGSLWLLVPVYVLFRMRFFGAFAPVQLTRNVSWYEAILSAFPLAGQYVWKMIWPVHLIAYYPFHKTTTPFDLHLLAGVAALGVWALAFGVLWKHGHRASFGFIWFFINIAPVLNSRWLGPNVFTERYLYLPSVGFCWVAAWWVWQFWNWSASRPPSLSKLCSTGGEQTGGSAAPLCGKASPFRGGTLTNLLRAVWKAAPSRRRGERETGGPGRKARGFPHSGAAEPREPLEEVANLENSARPNIWRMAFAAFLGVLSVLGFVRIVTRNRDWRNDETYYRVTLAAVPEAESLRMNLGAVYWNHMQPDAAEREWEKALVVAPQSAPLLNNLGLVSLGRKQYGEAIEYFQRSMWQRPNYTDAHLNLGRVYEAMGKAPDAELQLQAAAALAPLSVETRNELGNFYFTSGRLPEAAAQFQASAANIPNAGAYDSLADIALREGKRDAAEQNYRQAIGVDDFDPRGHFGLAAILAASGRTSEAADHYRAGLSVDPRNQKAQAALARLTTNSPHVNIPKP